MTPKVLALFTVLMATSCQDKLTPEEVEALANVRELLKLRADNVRLRGLIAAMEHESRCAISPHVRLEAFGDGHQTF